MAHQLLNIVLGNPTPAIEEQVDASVVLSFLAPFKKHGFNQIDTAHGYFNGEENFGKVDLKKEGFIVDTKVKSFQPGTHKAETIKESVQTSFDRLKVDKINVLYLHAPDRATPFEETLRAINDVHKEGKFEKFGISNYTAAEVREILAIVDKNGWVRPTVYQGNYSPIVRSNEPELFPLLKKEKISFYAYSPLGAGILTGKVAKNAPQNTSHFSGVFATVFQGLFFRDVIFAAVEDWVAFAKQHNLTPTELALRWLAYHSKLSKADGDAIILGASRPEQFESSLQELEKGPLPKEAAQFVDSWYDKVKSDPIPYHF